MSDRQKGGILVDSEDLSQCSNYENATKGLDEEVECAEHDGDHSDYGDEGPRNLQALDSADEENASGSGSDSDSVIVEDEREEGDGQESLPGREKKLDDDEDRRNPQYIPKKGTFYEHDDRTADDGESKERDGKEREGKEREGKEPGKESSGRKIWKEKEDRWKHDRFQETEQMPKSREELLQVYGYDIRSEESPPKARRRRRYGRGPNKYTRSWEDEAAYGRPLSAFIVEKEGPGDGPVRATTATGRRKGPPNRGERPEGNKGRPPRRDHPRQDFPALTPTTDHAAAENGQKPKVESQTTTFSSKVGGETRVTGSFKMNPRDVIPPFRNQQNSSASSQSQETRQSDKGNAAISQQQGPQSYINKSEEGNKRSWRREDGDDSRRQGSGRIEGRPRPQSGGVRRRSGDWQDQNGQNRGRPVKSGDTGRTVRPGENGHQSDSGSQKLVEDVRSLTISNSHQGNTPSGGDFARRHSNGNNAVSNNGAANNYRQTVVPPRMQESASSRPKRYSSVRPRNMPEAAIAVAPAQQGQGQMQGQMQGQTQGQMQGQNQGQSQPVTSVPVAAAGPVSGPGPGPLPGAVPGTVPVAGAGSGATPPPPPVTSPFNAPAHSYYQPGYPQPIYADTTGQQPVPNQVVVEASGSAQMMVRPPQGVAGGMPPPPGALAPPPFPAGFPQPPPPYMTPPPGPTARLLPATGYMAPAAAPPPQPINFVAAPNAQGQFQPLAFPTYQPIAMVSQVNQPQPQEMYQRQSGITYYSPQNQAVPRAVPQPRVKAAIPIVPPPELASRHRDEVDVSGEHDPASLRHSPSPGHGHAPTTVPLTVPMVLPMDASCQPVCPSPPQVPVTSPSPSGVPLQRCEETVAVTVESVMSAPSNSAEPSPEGATKNQQSMQNDAIVEPALQPS